MAIVGWKFTKTLITLELTGIATDATKTTEWTAVRDGKLIAILVNRADGQPWSGSLITVKRDEDVLTEPNVLCGVLGTNWWDKLELEETFTKGMKWSFALTNKEGVTITAYITLVITPP